LDKIYIFKGVILSEPITTTYFDFRLWRRVLDTTFWDEICQYISYMLLSKSCDWSMIFFFIVITQFNETTSTTWRHFRNFKSFKINITNNHELSRIMKIFDVAYWMQNYNFLSIFRKYSWKWLADDCEVFSYDGKSVVCHCRAPGVFSATTDMYNVNVRIC
jgi:hypothetical protein